MRRAVEHHLCSIRKLATVSWLSDRIAHCRTDSSLLIKQMPHGLRRNYIRQNTIFTYD